MILLQNIAKVLPVVLPISDIPVKVRVGITHDVICGALGIAVSKPNIKLIKAVIKAAGIRQVAIRGCYYYTTKGLQ